jgi:pyrimidine oxygenase
MLDEVAEVPGCEGVLLTFDDFLEGMDAYRRAHPAADEKPRACAEPGAVASRTRA